jgi:hypothetical protein
MNGRGDVERSMKEVMVHMAVAAVAVSGVLLDIALYARAVAAESPAPSLQACRREPDDARRLSCYDRKMDELAANPARTFGLTEQQVQATSQDANSVSRPVERVTATIMSMQLHPTRGFVITLDNGQVWRETPPDGEPRIKVGDSVTIEPALFGSFRLTTPGTNWSTKVHRLQ